MGVIRLRIRIQEFFKEFFNIASYGHFLHNLAHISGESDLILMKIFITAVSVDKEELIKFWNSSASGSRRCENWQTSILEQLHGAIIRLELA